MQYKCNKYNLVSGNEVVLSLFAKKTPQTTNGRGGLFFNLQMLIVAWG
jgi:hypothetical protein